MKVIRKPDATPEQQRLTDKAERIAKRLKLLPDGSPLVATSTEHYERVVDLLGYDPIV